MPYTNIKIYICMMRNISTEVYVQYFSFLDHFIIRTASYYPVESFWQDPNHQAAVDLSILVDSKASL